MTLRALVPVVVLLGIVIPWTTQAQVCEPKCRPGNHCIFVGSQDDPNAPTTCIRDAADGEVEEVVVTAAGSGAPTFAKVVDGIVNFVDAYIIPLLYALAFLFFVFGIFRYFFTGGEENREKARPFIVWSLVGMLVIFSVWGIVNLLLSTIPGA